MTGTNRGYASQSIVQIATAMVSGNLDLVTGCRMLCALRHEVDVSEPNLFDPIIAFESEIDGFPVGDIRSQYSYDYLQKLDRELEEYVDHSTPAVLDACKRIIEALE